MANSETIMWHRRGVRRLLVGAYTYVRTYVCTYVLYVTVSCIVLLMASNVLQCPICSSTSLTLKLYVSHLRIVHSNDPAFNVMCGVGGCREVFRAFSAFNSHIYRHHRAAIGVTSNADDSRTVEVGFSDTASLLNSAGDLELPGDTSTGICESYGASEVLAEHNSTTAESRVEVAKRIVDSQSETAAKFLLSLREGRQISQVAVADLICGCKELCQQTSEIIEQGVQEHLVRVGIDFEQIQGLPDVFEANHNPFHGVDTNHMFEKFCIEHLGYLVS